ncbi:hypothetical protein BU17DRAFT_41797 [Hysterangium stoloniferum]|nr:hypothetical protein BU17DRAFT_41797 [Hysterangium stoloniferum]
MHFEQHAETAALIATILRTPTDGLPDILGPIETWKWPRSDLHSWIKVLNKFDTVLEEIIRNYEVDKLQVNTFTPLTKRIICSILTFERLLLENSTNRKLFCSYDRLSSLLFTSDLDVLVADLQLLLRPAQQYSAQASVSHALNISTPRLQALAKRWPGVRENGLEFVDIASDKKQSEVEALPTDASQVIFTFYRKPSTDEKKPVEVAETDPFDAQQRKQPTTAPVSIHLGPLAQSSKSTMDILADAVEKYSVPNEEKFELMCKIRVARALGKEHFEERVKLVMVRLLAIAVFCLTQTESLAQSTIFLYEPDLVAQVAEFLHLDRGVSSAVQTAAIAALDGMGRYRSKIQELLTAVNAGVNHGILMSLLRRTVTEISNPESTLPNLFVEALISFVTFIASHTSGGSMVVGAGLIPMLIQVIENKTPSRLSIVSKAMQLVDNIVYGFPNAFQLFCNARGVDAVVRRIEVEVDLDIQENGDKGVQYISLFDSRGHLSFVRASVLKHTLRTLHRMMQTSGTSEGLRGLIDSSLIKSIKKIIEHRALFGASVLPIAIHVMSTFVHNEPTSLAVLQEAKLPETFYKAVEGGIEPSIEVVQAIINALGALCLNQAGQDQLAAKPTIISSVFSIFTSERHLKVLSEKENAAIVGSAVDELIRHHPTLKDAVFTAITSVLQRVEDLGEKFVEEKETESSYRLVLVTETERDTAKMEVVDGSHVDSQKQESAGTDTPDGLDTTQDSDQVKSEAVENTIVAFVDVISRFLEGLFQHTPHCRDFVTNTDGLDRLGKIVTLHCIPYNYASSPASDAFVQVLRAMTEVAPTQTISKVLVQVRSSLDDTREFWETMDGNSKLLKCVDVSNEEELLEANAKFRKLTALHTRVTLLADIFSSAAHVHGRSALSLLPGLVGPEATGVLADLGGLHRACIWENIVLKGALAARGLSPGRNGQIPASEATPSTAQASTVVNGPDVISAVQELESLSEEPKAKETAKKEGPQERNAKALKHIATQIPTSLTPFFQAVVKMPSLYTRRSPDPSQKRQAATVAEQVAYVALNHLKGEGSDDKLASYAYWTVMMGLITVLLFEERSSQNNIHTMLLVAFRRVGGIDTLLNICRRYALAVDRIIPIKTTERSEEDKQELVHVFGGLKVALHLLHSLVSSKPLFESPQTALLVTRDKKDTEPDYFEPQDFLVKLRLAILPFIRELWEASWLVSAPLSVCKSVVQTMLELMAAENEEPKGESASDTLTAPMTGMFHRQVGPPDENGIQQLHDMGFPRSAAERALTRMRNNVGAAAEYLLAQPFPLPPDAEHEEPAVVAVAAEVIGNDEVENPPAVDQEQPNANEESRTDAEMIPEIVDAKTSEQWRAELVEAREPLKEYVGRRALQLLDEHPSLIFDVKNAFIGPVDGYSTRTLPLIIQDIKEFSPGAYEVHEQPLAIRCRLLAIILNEINSLETRLGANASKELMDVLLALLLAHPANIDSEISIVPKWLASHLLVTEALLVAGDEPRNVTIPQEDEPIVPQAVTNEPSYPTARSKVFQFSLKLLQNMSLPQDELIAVLRLLVYLTRDHAVANELVKVGGIATLLERFKSLSKDTNGCQIYVALIFRHVTEDQTTLESIMRQEIKRWFSQPRTRMSDVTNYIRGSGGMALRDPATFVKVTESMCQLVQTHPSVQHIALKGDPVSSVPLKSDNADSSDQMQIDEPVREIVSDDTLEAMVHHLISELMRVGRPAVIASSTKTSTPPVSGDNDPASSSAEAAGVTITPATSPENEGRADYLYACFLMQCLTELLFSYNSCKMAFLTYSKKKSTTPSKEVFTKHRATVVNFLLSELTSFGTLESVSSPDNKRRSMLCNWAMSVIVALCVHVPEANEAKELSGDLVAIRRLVLDALNRAIKDASPLESTDERYGRLLTLVDLCHRLLTIKSGLGSVQKSQDEAPLHMAKLMLEKNYVAILTNALSEVDINYPNVRSLVIAILRPLEHLSKVAIKMGRITEKGKEKIDERLAPLESESSDNDAAVEDNNREETPDLYRNSALGIYAGEMDDTNNYVSEDDMDEDGELGDEVEMDYGEDDTTGSENTSSDSEVEDPHGTAIDVEPHSSDEEGWHDEDDDEDDMNDDDEEGDGDEVDDDDEDDGLGAVGDNQEITWQDVAGAPAELDDGQAEDMDEEDIMEGCSLTHIFVRNSGDIGLLEHADLVHSDGEDAMGQWFGELAVSRDGHQHFFPGPPITGRRRTGKDIIFGSPRAVVATGTDNSTHPLLVDPSGPGGLSNSQTRGSHRRSNRGNQAANAYTDLLQTIEDLVSGGALQLFQQLMSVGRGGPGELHIDLAPIGGHLVPGLDRAAIHRHSGRSAALFATRPDRSGRIESRTETQDFGPLPTLQRWADEAKMTHGKFITDRVGRLGNNITLALLPAVRETELRKAKEQEERLKAEAEAKAATEAAREAELQQSVSEETPQLSNTKGNEEQGPTNADTSTVSLLEQDGDTVMEDALHASAASEPTPGVDAAVAGMEGGPSTSSTLANPEENVASTSSSARITVMVHGNAVDITDTGIDPTFLEALPDDMREEVLNQHFRERRTAMQEQPSESQISPEFLDALPPELRAEILQAESNELARVRAAATAQSTAASGPTDMDPASFLASLDPQLRQVVLMDQEEGFLQTLPSHLIAEATVWRDGANRRLESPPGRGNAAAPGPPQQETPRKTVVQRDAIQLLDKSGLASLVRLLFFPQLPRKNLLLKIFVNLCENTKTRAELLNLLLNILQDGTGDLAAVDKSFAQLSFRNRTQSFHTTPKGPAKSKPSVETPNTWQVPGENIPNLVVQRSLEALTYIVSSNETASRFFLTEHEMPSGLKRAASRKGKGKEKQVPQMYYPIVPLLALLDRQTLLRTPTMMDSLAALLATITRPLISLKDSKKEEPSAVRSVEAALDATVEPPGPNVEPSMSATNDILSGKDETVPKTTPLQPPVIPQSSLRLIVNILTVGECSGRTFQSTLALIQHLSCLPDARDTIASELKSRAQELGVSIHNDLDELVAVLQQDNSGEEVPVTISAKFSPASSDQAKLLRILKTIDYMYSSKGSPSSQGQSSSDSEPPPNSSDEEKVHTIYESFRFAALWRRLGDCLAIVEEKPDVEHMATVLLPLIESLMVVCKYVGSKANATRAIRGSASPRSSITPRESMEDLFVSFTDAHRKVLNLMVRNNPSLMSGSFALLVQNPRVLDFDNKRNYFYQQLRRRPHNREHHGTLQLNVRRPRVFEDSFQYLQRKSGEQIKYGKLSVRFYDEEGVDAGGVTREWFQILARQMFNPNYALFEPCAADKLTYQPNRASWVNPEHLSFFKFVGRIIGKAIFDNRLLDAYFARSLYRQLLGKLVDHRDVEWVDPEYYNSLVWILENDPTPLDLTFSTEADEFGVTRLVELKDNGATTSVTQDNKREFVQLSAQYRLTKSIKEQIDALLGGFYDIIPKDLIAIFNEQEVELLISGTPDIDIDEWRAATEYNGYTSSDPVIVWWWRALKSFNRDERAKVLSFATGTARVPLGGFVELQGVQGVQRFSIHKAYGESDRLPQAHTCAFDLPQYSSYEMLRQQVLLAINEGGEGFGFA